MSKKSEWEKKKERNLIFSFPVSKVANQEEDPQEARVNLKRNVLILNFSDEIDFLLMINFQHII